MLITFDWEPVDDFSGNIRRLYFLIISWVKLYLWCFVFRCFTIVFLKMVKFHVLEMNSNMWKASRENFIADPWTISETFIYVTIEKCQWQFLKCSPENKFLCLWKFLNENTRKTKFKTGHFLRLNFSRVSFCYKN